jgi:GNAT superfamily N-acetyltransferase
VGPAASAREWAVARSLVDDLLHWIASELKLDAIAVQEGALEELADLSAFYAFPRGLFLLGTMDGEPAGTAGVRLLDASTAELKRFWVAPSARGRGLARLLLARALDAARTLGASSVVLETDAKLMGTAIQMYRAAGIREAKPYTRLSERVPAVLTLQKRVA